MKESVSVFKLRDLLNEASVPLLRRPGRSLLTALGTIVGVGAFVATTGLAATAQAQVSGHFDALAATQVWVLATDQTLNDNEAAAGVTNPFPPDTQQRLERLNGVVHAGTYWEISDNDLDIRALATPSAQPQPVAAMGISPGALAAAQPELAAGRIFDEFHNDRTERVVVLGRTAADQLGINRVDQQPAIFIGNRPYVVVGIIDDVARLPQLLQAVLIPADTAARDFGGGKNHAVLISVQPGAAQLIASQAALAVRPQNPAALEVVAPPDPGSFRETIKSDITGLLYGLAGLALLVGMIGIANTTLVAVLERRAEIGVRRALGARRRHIASQFLTESGALGALGGLIGTSLGIIVVVSVASQRHWTTTLDPRLTFPAPIIGMLTGILAGLHPACRASTIPPAAALRAQ